MLDPETFLTELYVVADSFCQTALPPERQPGPTTALDRSEVVTLALYAPWARFRSERDFWRDADTTLRPLFPRLPDRAQFNRQVRRQRPAITAFALRLAAELGAPQAPDEAPDSTAVPTRNAKRRGRGWLPGLADIGFGNRRGWSEGCHLLVATTPDGVVTGFGFGPASSNDRALAEAFFAQRTTPRPALASVGQPASGIYVSDAGEAGVSGETRWAEGHQAQSVAPPHAGSRPSWPKAKRRRDASWRQIIETVFDRLQATFRLDSERPHALDGFQARLAAKVALHNFCLRLNRRRGRPALALVELFGW